MIPEPPRPPVAAPLSPVVVDPADLARRSAVPAPGAAAERLVAAARDLASALVAAVPAVPGRPAGGRSAPLAQALAEHWAERARAWAHGATEHAARVAGAGVAFAALDEDGATVLARAGSDR